MGEARSMWTKDEAIQTETLGNKVRGIGPYGSF